MERIEEEMLSEIHRKKRKKKRKKNAEYTGWDDEGKRINKKGKGVKYEEVEDKDGNIIKIKNVRKSRLPMEIKVENK